MICKVSVEEWLNSISSLPEEKFFGIIHLYLGEIKTPYNKQRLLEQLAGFINNSGNQQNIISLLDEFDLKILTVITLINNVTRETLMDFFKYEYPVAELYEELSNLCSRLILFTQKDKYSDKEYYRINPLLADNIFQLTAVDLILKDKPVIKKNLDDSFILNAGFVTAFISYIRMNNLSCKNDGTLKKNDLNKIQETFTGKVKVIQLLLNAFINLNLVTEGLRGFEIDYDRFELFAAMDEKQQLALFCAASFSRLSRDGLKTQSQLLLDCLASIPKSGFTWSTIIRLAFLIGSNQKDYVSSASRFSRMINEARADAPELYGTVIERMLEAAIEFGLLKELGINESDEKLFAANTDALTFSKDVQKVLSIDSTFTVTLMPGLSLAKLLSVSKFLEVKSYNFAAEFEISRKSVSQAFDEGLSPDDIISEIENLSIYEIPENLKILIFDWYNSYSSAVLYKGFVLKASEKNISLIENNPKVKKYIKEKLADGIYFLNIPLEMDACEVLKSCGIEFMGKIKNSDSVSQKMSFPLLSEGKPLDISKTDEETKIDFSKAAKIIREIKTEFESMNLTDNERESLMHRISNRLIINKEQLLRCYIKTEILEAGGMDFNGKVHLLESASKDGDLVELTFASLTDENKEINVVGHPLSIIHHSDDAILRFELEPSKSIDNLLVGKISHVKRLRF